MAVSTQGQTVLYGSGLTGEIDKILKDVWEPMMQRLFTNETGFLQAFKRYSKMPDVGGRKWNVKLHIRPGQGIGSRSERASTTAMGSISTTTGTNLPIPVPQTVDDCYVRPTWHYWAVGFTGQALRVAKGDPYSFAKTQTWEMSEVFNEFMYDFNRQLLGNGSGIVAITNTTAAGSANDEQHDAGTTGYEWYFDLQDAKKLRIGAYYDIYGFTGTAAVCYDYNVQCTNVDLDNNLGYFMLTADSLLTETSCTNFIFCRAGNGVTPTTTAGVAIVPSGTGGHATNEMMGIAGVCDDGTEQANFQNLSRATYPELKGVVSRAVGELTPIKLKTLFDKVLTRVGKRPDACIVGQGVDRAVFAILEPYRRYVGPEVVFGYDTVPIIIDGKKLQWLVEPQLAAGQLLAPKWDTMEYWQIADPAWADDDGKILRKAPENSDTWNAFGRYFGNLVCLNPQGNARMEGISEA